VIGPRIYKNKNIGLGKPNILKNVGSKNVIKKKIWEVMGPRIYKNMKLENG